MVIYLAGDINDEIVRIFDNNLEIPLCFLGEKIYENLFLREFKHDIDSANSTSMQNLMVDYLPIVKKDPERYELVSGHIHSRKYGEKVELFDPYWTLVQGEGLTPGDIVEGRFFVTKKPNSKGDLGALRSLYAFLRNSNGIEAKKNYFCSSCLWNRR